MYILFNKYSRNTVYIHTGEKWKKMKNLGEEERIIRDKEDDRQQES